MARKTRRDTRSDRRTASAVPAPLRSRDPVPKRNTFKVAQAYEELRNSVGDLVYQPRPRSSRTVAAPLQSDATQAQPYKVVSVNKQKERVNTPEKTNVNLVERPTCKPRPTSNKGNGGSRRFIPYCKG